MLLAAVTGMARTVPLGLGYRIAELLSEGHRVLAPARRSAVERNLRAVAGAAEPPRLAREVFRNHARFLFEFLRGPDVAEIEHRFERWEALEAVLARGRGVILAVLHTGNWEITGARMARAGVPVHAVAATQLRPGWTRELRRRQAAAGIRILPPTVASWRDLPRILARNEALALLVDGNVYRKGLRVELFGRAATLPAGPARLAARTGAGLLPLVCFRRCRRQLGARFLEEVPVAGDSPEEVRRATQKLARRLERALGEVAGEWMIFRPFFGGSPGAARRGKGRRG